MPGTDPRIVVQVSIDGFNRTNGGGSVVLPIEVGDDVYTQTSKAAKEAVELAVKDWEERRR